VVFDVLVGLHVVSAVVGFGAVAITGVYGAGAARPLRPGAAEETARYFRSPGWAEWLVLAVPFLGAAALGVRPKGANFGQVWVVAAAVIWAVAATLLVGVVRPAERRIRAAVAAGATAIPAGRRLVWATVASDLLFVAALVLMIGQPS
jgi:Predicted integral membrane protein (DUF2269)